jgi:hypothetical protein
MVVRGPDVKLLLRDGLLDGVSLVVAGPAAGDSAWGNAVGAACAQLGARVGDCRLPPRWAPDADAEEVEQEVGRALLAAGGGQVLFVDGAGLFGAGGRDALLGALQAAWSFTRTLASREAIAGGGRVLLLAPAPDAGEHAGAARAALENLARTLSIEWARHGVTAVAIAPGAATTADEVAALTAYLCSPAGAYFSGCLLELDAVAGAH